MTYISVSMPNKKTKLIDIPEDIILALQDLAKKQNRSLKNYIETLLIDHVKEQKKKKA